MIETDEEDSNTQPTSTKQSKKITKGKKPTKSTTPIKKSATGKKDTRSTTPVKSATAAAAQKKKPKKTEDQKLPLPEDVADAVR